jgi:hypothetical protein
VEVFWNISGAKFGPPGPEPLEGFYVAVVCDTEMALLLGDMSKEAYRKTGAVGPATTDTFLVARREHIAGKKVYSHYKLTNLLTPYRKLNTLRRYKINYCNGSRWLLFSTIATGGPLKISLIYHGTLSAVID